VGSATNATPDEIAEVIKRCPSGALQYERLDGGPGEARPREVSVRFVPNGPAYVRTLVVLRDAGGKVIFQSTRIALCRCGASKNKPFCDNSHLETGFEAEGAQLEVQPGG
jgi:CDGSH-type Zn-finger protein